MNRPYICPSPGPYIYKNTGTGTLIVLWTHPVADAAAATVAAYGADSAATGVTSWAAGSMTGSATCKGGSCAVAGWVLPGACASSPGAARRPCQPRAQPLL